MGIRPAATIVVARPGESNGPSIEVLLLRRSGRSRFAAGFVVFPGGVVEGGDAELADRWFGSRDELARACAVRELAEEAGLVATAGGLVEAPGRLPGDPGFPPPQPSSLPEMARWVAPEFLPVRFDARFFAVSAPPGLAAYPDGVEVDLAWWAAPEDALEAHRRGDGPLLWPTLKTLEALADCASVADVLALRVTPVPPPIPGVMTEVRRVLAPNPGPYTLEGTNTWIVGDSPSLVIDPGPDDRGHVEAVARLAGAVAAILLTHHHPDHAPGAALLAQATGAPILALRPAPGEEPLAGGKMVRAGTAALRVLSAPGHTPDHVVFHDPESGAMFTGDVVLGRGTSVVDPPEGDLRAYLGSLVALLEVQPTVLYPGHGPIVPDGAAKLREYLAHRKERERQVLAGLEDGPKTPPELVPDIYADHPVEIHPAASRSVLAHLLKLEAEGRVVRIGEAGDERFALTASGNSV